MTDWDALNQPDRTPGSATNGSAPGSDETSAPPRRPLDLWALPDDIRRTVWVELVDWVGQLVADYSLTDWPRCWWEHRGMIAEVLALRELHRGAYASNDPQQVIMWHERLWAIYGRYRHHTASIDHDPDDQTAKLIAMRAEALDSEPGRWGIPARTELEPPVEPRQV